jgi:hypothetical protein
LLGRGNIETPDPKAALREIFGALKPSGVLAVTEVIADPHFQRRGKVTALASLVGFCEMLRIGGHLAYTIYPADDCLIEQPYAVVYALSLR